MTAIVLLPAAVAFAPAATGPRGPTLLRAETETKTDEFIVALLGELHIDPRKLEDYETGRSHFLPIFQEAKSDGKGVFVISLGDLGESKNCDHNPESDSELFAGTTQCHEMAAEFLGSFDVPYDVVGGNHDLEGLDEFETDAENL